MDPLTVAVLDQQYAEMSAQLDRLVDVAHAVVDSHGPEYGALLICGQIQLEPSWTAETLSAVLSVALARLAVKL